MQGPLPIIIVGLLLFFAKLWLISGNEIVARNAPHDQTWFVKAAQHLIKGEWLGPYTHMSLIRPVAYPFWVFFNNWLGVPLRIGIEILLFFSAAIFSRSLVGAGLTRWKGLLVFCIILFFPYTFRMNGEAESETLYMPILLLATACMISFLVNRSKLSRAAFGLGFGLCMMILWHTRHEHVILLFYILFFAILHFFTRSLRDQTKERVLVSLFYFLVPSAVLIFGSSIAISLKNCSTYGVFNSSEMFAPGYSAALNILATVETKKPGRYVSVPKDARQAAYSVSPAFRRLEPWLEGELGKGWARFNCERNGVCDDLGSAWFQWAVRESADKLGVHRSAREADRYYQSIADEVGKACEERHILCHHGQFYSFGLINSQDHSFLGALPREILRLAYTMLHFHGLDDYKDPLWEVSFEQRRLFDETAHRRTQNTSPWPIVLEGKYSIKGWAAHFGDPIAEIQLRDEGGNVLASSAKFFENPEARQFLVKRDWADAPENTGFELKGDLGNGAPRPVTLALLTRTGKKLETQLRAELGSFDSFFYQIEPAGDGGSFRLDLKNAIVLVFNVLGWALAVLAIPAAIVLVMYRRSPSIPDFFPYALALLFFVAAVRLGLFALYSVSVFHIDPWYIRFLYPVAPLLYCSLLLLDIQATQILLKKRVRV